MEILKSVGAYEQARRLVGSNTELVNLFSNRFRDLVATVQNETASRVSSPGRP